MTPQKILTGLLGAQILLAVVTWWPRGGDIEARPVLPFAADAITSIRIQSTTTDNRGDGLVLERRDGGWVIASEYDYPAVTEKVDEIVDKLEGLKVKAPIALQAASHDQLNVTDAKATRRVTVSAGDQQVQLRLGVAGNARSYLRIGDENEVYAVSGVGAWSIKDTSAGFLERKVLDVAAGALESYSLLNPAGGLELTRGPDGQWTSPDLTEGQALDVTKVDKLFKDTLSLNLTAPADPAFDPFTADGNAILRWTTTEDGQSVTNAVALAVVDETGIVRVEDQSKPVKMGSLSVRKVFLETTLDRLLVGAEPDPVQIH
ncbi:MAG: DUF4340 domain-containing protein [Alphaproteobacteria bacterium]|nr:DUF4340 domain-containing protein [Alphaproteobacteria bacterium]